MKYDSSTYRHGQGDIHICIGMSNVLRIDGDVNREVNQSWCESHEPMRLTAAPAIIASRTRTI